MAHEQTKAPGSEMPSASEQTNEVTDGSLQQHECAVNQQAARQRLLHAAQDLADDDTDSIGNIGNRIAFLTALVRCEHEPFDPDLSSIQDERPQPYDDEENHIGGADWNMALAAADDDEQSLYNYEMRLEYGDDWIMRNVPAYLDCTCGTCTDCEWFYGDKVQP